MLRNHILRVASSLIVYDIVKPTVFLIRNVKQQHLLRSQKSKINVLTFLRLSIIKIVNIHRR